MIKNVKTMLIKVLNYVHIVLIEIEYAFTMLNYKVSRKSKRTGYQMVHLVVYMFFICI